MSTKHVGRDPLAFLGEELDESSGGWLAGASPPTSESPPPFRRDAADPNGH